MNLMQQYREAKSRHPDMMLLFRMGDFYELFDQDAKDAARVLGLNLGLRDNSPVAGFPHHQLEVYLVKLLHLGRRVAVCDQVEGSIKRNRPDEIVTRIVMPFAQ